MYIHGSEYSPEKRVFACWSREDSHGQVWDAQIGQRVFKFQTFSVAEIPLALIEDTQTFIQDVDVLCHTVYDQITLHNKLGLKTHLISRSLTPAEPWAMRDSKNAVLNMSSVDYYLVSIFSHHYLLID